MEVLEKVKTFIHHNTPLTTADPVLVAISGGPDSHVLLDILIRLGFKKISAAHVNYHMRDEASDLDEKCAKAFVEGFGLPFYKKDIRISATSGNFQSLARKLRYDWFAKIMKEKGISYLLTAHHLDDQIETVVMRFFSGTRGRGLRGIDVIAGQTIRPLLCLEKDAILDYAYRQAIPFREDQSNNEASYLRNFFRNQILPQIENKIPNLTKRIETTRKNLLREHKLLSYLCLEQISSKGFWQGQALVIPTSAFLNPEVLHHFLCFQFQLNKNEALQITASRKNQLCHFQPFRIALFKDQIWVDKKMEKSEVFKTLPQDYPSHILLPNGNLSQELTSSFEISKHPHIEFIPRHFLKAGLYIRSWKKGDKIEIEGGNHKKVSDLLNEHQLSPIEKEKVCCLLYKDTILWVIGIRLSRAAFSNPSDSEFIQFKFDKEIRKKVNSDEIKTFFRFS